MAVITGTNGNDNPLFGNAPLIGTNAADTIYGLVGHDLIEGRGGNDTLDGGSGFDTILGGNGNDTIINGTGDGFLDGGAGTDWVDFTGNDNGGLFVLEGGTAQLGPSGFIFTMRNFENIKTGSGSDRIFGTQGNNIIEGGAGDDFISAQGGNDRIRGGAGNDTLFGGAGNDVFEHLAGSDTIDGGSGFDTLDYRLNDLGIIADVAAGRVTHINFIDSDVFQGIEKIVGSSYTDFMYAGATTELDGFSGDDLIASGSGANRLTGGAGLDHLTYLFSTAGVSINLDSGAVSGGWAQGDRIAGFESLEGSDFADTLTGSSGANFLEGRDGNDRINGGGGADDLYGGNGDDQLNGGSGNDRLYGFYGNDTIRGDAGNDVIVGQDGADTLFGGAGADRFRYDATSESPAVAGQMDVIRDFSRSQGDKIDLAAVYGPTLAFIGKAAFSAAGQVRFVQSGGNTTVEVNTAGAGDAEMAIRLSGTINLQASDFIL